MIRSAYLLAATCVLVSNLNATVKITEEAEEIPERGKVLRYAVLSEAGRFTMMPPQGWLPQLNQAEDTLTFRATTTDAVFSVRFLGGVPPRGSAGLKRQIAELWPDGTLLDEAPCIVRDAQGVMAELTYPAAAKTLYHTRLAVIPYPQGAVEFKLTAPDASFPAVQAAWVSLLNSFQRQVSKPVAG